MERNGHQHADPTPWRTARQESIREDRKSEPVPEYAKQAAKALEGVAETKRIIDDL